MTNEELREALFSGCPVQHGDVIYKCVSAIIYRKGKRGKLNVSAELMDRNCNSVSIVEPERIKEVITRENRDLRR